MVDLIGKTIVDAEVDGYGIKLTFDDGSVFDYEATDGGYSGWEITKGNSVEGGVPGPAVGAKDKGLVLRGRAFPQRKYEWLPEYWCACGRYLGVYKKVNYCPDCGRKIIWDE